MEIPNEQDVLKFYRRSVRMLPTLENLPTLADADEHKFPAINQLLLQMREFSREMTSVGLALQASKNDSSPYNKSYQLTDTRFKNLSELEIYLESKWFDKEYPIPLHGGFKFQLYIEQKIHPEISDWLNISICHLNVMPMSFVSAREYDRYLVPVFYRGKRFFDGIPLGPKERNFSNINNGLTFNIKTFNQCLDDACAVMRALIATKDSLVAIP